MALCSFMGSSIPTQYRLENCLFNGLRLFKALLIMSLWDYMISAPKAQGCTKVQTFQLTMTCEVIPISSWELGISNSALPKIVFELGWLLLKIWCLFYHTSNHLPSFSSDNQPTFLVLLTGLSRVWLKCLLHLWLQYIVEVKSYKVGCSVIPTSATIFFSV